MRIAHFLALLLTPLLVVFLLGAWYRSDRVTLPAVEVEPPAELAGVLTAAPLAEAQQLVQQAAAQLARPDRLWLRTDLWLHVHLPEVDYQAEGFYQRASGSRRRLELRTRSTFSRTEHIRGGLLLVCDGVHLWQASRTGPRGYEEVKRWQLPPEGLTPAMLTDFAATGSTVTPLAQRGPEGLLASLVQQWVWVRHLERGTDRIVVGIWNPQQRDRLAPRSATWPVALPRLCRVFLRGSESWPARTEWWGPAEPGGPDRLLVEIEFRNPEWNRQLSDLECQRLFHFEPGSARVEEVNLP
jgi:hypothetical protein